MSFVDIHNHILPGVDDGALDVHYALEMARRAVAGGTEIMVATPHRCVWQRPDAPANWVRAHVRALQRRLKDAKIPLKVVPGVEIPVGPGLAEALAAGRLVTLGDTGRWALIEPPFDEIPVNALDHLQDVVDAGIGVVLAHPERNAVIQENLSFLESCARLGINVQLTSGSLLGAFGRRAKFTAEAILERHAEWEIVIASDAHDLSDRPPDWLAQSRDAAAKIVGDEAANAMVDSRPRAMVAYSATEAKPARTRSEAPVLSLQG
ncbi:MAG: tyrosine-protein phosphatase [Capsulimonadaceae bacterium]